MRHFYKKHFLLIPLLSVTVLACNNANNNATSGTDSTTIGQKLKSAANDVGAAATQAASKIKDAADQTADEIQSGLSRNPDSSFLANVYKSNVKEQKLLQVAQNKAANTALHTDAMKMQTDHNRMQQQLKDFATSNNYYLPDDTAGVGNGEIQEINDNSIGNDWDKAWTKRMIHEHKGEIDYFEAAKDRVHNTALRAFILNTLPILRNHLTTLQNLQDNL